MLCRRIADGCGIVSLAHRPVTLLAERRSLSEVVLVGYVQLGGEDVLVKVQQAIYIPVEILLAVLRMIEFLVSDRVEGTAEGLAQSIRDPFEQQATMNMMANSARSAQAMQNTQATPTQPQVIQNNTFNQVADNLDVKEASKLLGFEVATAI